MTQSDGYGCGCGTILLIIFVVLCMKACGMI